jgi:hypothetical protein
LGTGSNRQQRKIANGRTQESFMQIISINKIFIQCVFAIFLALHGSSAFAVGLVLPFGEEQKVYLEYADETISIKRNKQKLIADKQLSAHLKKTDELLYLLTVKANHKKWPLFLVLSREPSRKNRGAIFCGAGYEDYALLLQMSDAQIKLKDKFLLQSCTSNKTLFGNDVDGISEPVKAIQISIEDEQIMFTWLSDMNKKYTLSVSDNLKIKILETLTSK